jgi:hypothetical protein
MGYSCTKDNQFFFTLVTIDGVDMPDFGFRSFRAHLNDYDLFMDYAPCWDAESATNSHITAFYQRNPQAVAYA